MSDLNASTSLPDIMGDSRAGEIIRLALAEDIGPGDVTTNSLIPGEAVIEALIIAREPCVVSGNPVAAAVFGAVDARLVYDARLADGTRAEAGATVAAVSGPARGILTGERTALNFMQRMSGIATLTRHFVDKVSRYGTAILDTRKTTPALRVFEKYAVRCGGGCNHRFGLFDRVLIKDNHRRLWRSGEASRLDLAIAEARRCFPGVAVEVEVETEEELRSALAAKPEWILLDNMAPDAMARCVAICAGRSKLEASGGIGLRNVEEAAASGVDAVSLGALTHSAPSVDLSLEIV
jgi:nicotinate-nucleotide pyrophosphorylase (carboxylating)